MQYNEKYDRYVDDDLVIYRWDDINDKLVQVNPYKSRNGYMLISCTTKTKYHRPIYLHRFLWETFVGEIPQGYQLDHINTIRDDNRLENLRVVTCKENGNNPLTLKHKSEAHKGKFHTNETKKKMSESKLNKPNSDFGRKYFEHFGYSLTDNRKQYHSEYSWYLRHNNKCRWEEK